MRAFDLWSRLLLLGFAAQVPLGVSVAVAYRTPLWAWHRRALAGELWGTPDLPADAVPVVDQLCAMLGGTMACWGLAMAVVVAVPFARRERWAWWCVAGSAAVWGVIDTGLSAMHGAWVNVAFNAAALVAMGVPLAATWRAFNPSPAPPARRDR